MKKTIMHMMLLAISMTANAQGIDLYNGRRGL